MSNTPDLKGGSFTLTVLHIPDGNIDAIISYLEQKITKAPTFFKSAPVVINVEKLNEAIDFDVLKAEIVRCGMIPVGVTGGHDKHIIHLAKEAGLAVMNGINTPQQAPVKQTPHKVITTPVRSGQQIFAKNCDLIILNHVSEGAEVIADGSIHIYGTLRGRAIAGASGQKEAYILCNDLKAELISIAGNYWLRDQIPTEFIDQKTIINYENSALQIKHRPL